MEIGEVLENFAVSKNYPTWFSIKLRSLDPLTSKFAGSVAFILIVAALFFYSPLYFIHAPYTKFDWWLKLEAKLVLGYLVWMVFIDNEVESPFYISLYLLVVSESIWTVKLETVFLGIPKGWEAYPADILICAAKGVEEIYWL